MRKYDDKGAPPFKVLKEGENPPLEAYDNFVIGPKYTPAPERKKVAKQKIRARPGWETIPAVANNRIVEIKSPLILQPGPAALTDGLDALVAAIR